MTPTPTVEQWAWLTLRTAAHESAHAVAFERLDVGRVEYVSLEGLPPLPGRDGLAGRVQAEILPGADFYRRGVVSLAGPAAELRLTGESAALPAAEVRHRAGQDVPDGATDAELHSYWMGAVEFVRLNWQAIEAGARALLAAVDPQRVGDGVITHLLPGADFREAMEQAA
jgi:hypothetical protein